MEKSFGFGDCSNGRMSCEKRLNCRSHRDGFLAYAAKVG